ncbi:MAG: 16S rRNA (guanine(527)-N(7))-methyltransferase RsmG [Gammaproteobacteria bacterium]|nr:16S rRNA (guanine(527)-N(7))-methyltransferase RsmG [Gammaproteobacteria bacterium]
MSEQAFLISSASRLGVSLDAAAAKRLLQLLDELERWNRSFNLTAITQRAQMLTHHLLDSLSIASLLQGERIIDIGTGAGFPGLPLAIIQPERQFTLLDSNGKKIRFVNHAARTLGLANVVAVHARAEQWQDERGAFNTVVTRAFAPLSELMTTVRGLCGADTRVLAMKGRRSTQERAGLSPQWVIEQDVELAIPGLDEERHALVLRLDSRP